MARCTWKSSPLQRMIRSDYFAEVKSLGKMPVGVRFRGKVSYSSIDEVTAALLDSAIWMDGFELG